MCVVQQLISEFMTEDKKFLFNLHHFTSVQGWELLDVSSTPGYFEQFVRNANLNANFNFNTYFMESFTSDYNACASFEAVKLEGDRKFQYRVVAGHASLDNERFLQAFVCLGKGVRTENPNNRHDRSCDTVSVKLTAATRFCSGDLFFFRILKS